MDLHYVYIGPCLFLWAAIHYQYGAVQQSTTQMKVKYNTIQLYCLCIEKFAFWLVIYIKHSIHLTIKHSDSMKHGNKNGSDTRKMLNNNNVHTYARRHARAYPPPPPPHTHTHTVSLSHTHTHTHTNKTTRTVSQVKSSQKSIQMGKTDTADYGDSKLINKSFSLSIIKV